MHSSHAGADAAASLQAAVNSCLSMLLAVAECVGTACPPVGGPYRHRLSRIQKRLSFDASTEALEETCDQVGREMEDYAAKAAAYLRCHEVELRQAAAGLEELLGVMAERQDFYAARLRQMAGEVGLADLREAPHTGPLALGRKEQARDLQDCIENMRRENQALVARMQDALGAVEQRISAFEIIDPVTGLINRRELERLIRAASADGQEPVLIKFHLGGPIPDDAARQVGARISSQFRYNDLVCRSGEREFAVLFQAPLEVAHMRSAQVAPWVAGRYLLDNGDIANIRISNVQVVQGLEGLSAAPAATLEQVASVV